MSTTTNEKTTLYLDPHVKKFLQHKAIDEGTSMSQILNDLIVQAINDERLSDPQIEVEAAKLLQ